MSRTGPGAPASAVAPGAATASAAAPAATTAESTPVTYLVPVKDGARWLERVLDALLREAAGREAEVLVVDDGSTDASPAILGRFGGRVRVLHGPGRGAAAALNLGLREARHPVVCQVDQDVVVDPGWTDRLLAALAEAPDVAAAQGCYRTEHGAGAWARVMGIDLEQRYSRIRARHVDHVCTGNTAYRVEALSRVGLLDETFGYGYDNDLSYRLAAAGFRLALVRDARAVHGWREGLPGYLRQQYGVGYGRLDLVAKHPGRAGGDQVSGLRMVLHVPALLLALAAAALAAGLSPFSPAWPVPAAIASGLIGLLLLDRLAAGLAAAIAFREPAALLFPLAHLLRDGAWVAALLVWSARRLAGRRREPSHSM